MTIEIDAIYHDGALHPQQPVSLPEGACVRVAIQTSLPSASPPTDGDPLGAVIGVGEGPAAGDAADRHDDYLYGKS